jgi:glycerol-3-phosphate dehydrogenase
MNRAEHLARISGAHVQVLVIGGGITGAGIAWDCALRGLSVALLERTDFAAGTSGVSSKMVHAGLRYIANDSGLVREAGVERERMFRACPHLARPIEYLLPAYDDTPEYNAATLAHILGRYDELCGRRGVTPFRLADSQDLLSAMPKLRRTPLLVGSYRDGVMDDARVTLEVILAASDAGAAVVNHAPVTAFIHDAAGLVRGARFMDEAPGSPTTEHTVTADAVVSAAGPYTDILLHLAGERGMAVQAIRPSKGIHLVFKTQATAGKAVVIPAGGNVLFFLIPIQRGYLAMGCTDLDYPVRSYADLDHVPVTEQEITDSLGLLSRVFPGEFGRRDIVACYSGVRPLVRPTSVAGRPLSESDTSRAHRIWKTEKGLWAVAGGKFTTFRLMAEQLVDQLVADLGRRGVTRGCLPCTTAERRYHGAPEDCEKTDGITGWLAETSARLEKTTGLPVDCCVHLCEAYGTAADRIGELVRAEPALGRRIGEGRPFVVAEIMHAVQAEMCLGATDFLTRRTPLRFLEHQGLDVLETVVDRLAGHLGWDSNVRERQVQEYRESIHRVWRGVLL